MLSKESFECVLKNTPLFSIDLIIENKKEEILLGFRTNSPAKGFWFVPGGRVFKDESLDEAFSRVIQDEVLLDKKISDGNFIGVFEHLYDDNVFGEKNFTTHYITMGIEVKEEIDLSCLPKSQHQDYKWWSKEELMSSIQVHQNTKDYFIKSRGIK